MGDRVSGAVGDGRWDGRTTGVRRTDGNCEQRKEKILVVGERWWPGKWSCW